MKRHQDQPSKNTPSKPEGETNQANNPTDSDPGSQHVERDRNTKDDQGTKRAKNELPGPKFNHNKRIRPLL